MVRPLAAKIVTGPPAQLVVDERRQPLECRLVALSPGTQQGRHGRAADSAISLPLQAGILDGFPPPMRFFLLPSRFPGEEGRDGPKRTFGGWMAVGFANWGAEAAAKHQPILQTGSTPGFDRQGRLALAGTARRHARPPAGGRLLAVSLPGRSCWSGRAKTHRFAWIRSWTICFGVPACQSFLSTTTRRALA